MPNWCEGTIKVRGKREKVRAFLIYGVNMYDYDFEKMESVLMPKEKAVVFKDEDWGTIIDISDGSYIEGTYRAFIDDSRVYLDNDQENVCVCLPFRQAWSIRAEDFDKLKDKWDVDFRLYGVDCGMGFAMEVIAERGEIVSERFEEYKDYDDFVWECPFPMLGG